MPVTTEVATPVVAAARERLDVLDAVRGAAVLGILLINIESLSGFGFVGPEVRAEAPLSRFDDEMALLLAIFVEAKFYALFSLLFGIGFAVFIERAAARGADAVSLFKRRLIGLLIIGVVHTVFVWFGDILVTYALLGFGLIPFLRKDDRSLLRLALILFLLPAVLYALAAAGALFVSPPVAAGPRGALPPVLADAAGHFAHGSYPQVIAGNIVFTLANALRRLGLMFFPRVFGMFLIGLYVGRTGMLAAVDKHRPRLRQIAVYGSMLGLPLALAGAVVPERLPPAAALLVEGVAKSLAIPMMTLSYAAMLSLFFHDRPGWRHAFAAPGRMALTNYLLHSLAGVIAFYGLGFGLFGRLSLSVLLALSVAVFAIQIVLSRAWLTVAAFGPAEWVWRMFTYRRRFPLFSPRPSHE